MLLPYYPLLFTIYHDTPTRRFSSTLPMTMGLHPPYTTLVPPPLRI